MRVNVVVGNLAKLYQAHHQRVIFADPPQLTVAVQVRAAVADVSNNSAIPRYEGHRHRGSHIVTLRPSLGNDRLVALKYCLAHQIADDDIYTHPQRNAVLRSLGDKSNVEVDIFIERLRSGDVLLLCSDGLWEMTRDAEMERILARDAIPQATCEALVSAANQAGGEDNISVVMVRFA